MDYVIYVLISFNLLTSFCSGNSEAAGTAGQRILPLIFANGHSVALLVTQECIEIMVCMLPLLGVYLVQEWRQFIHQDSLDALPCSSLFVNECDDPGVTCFDATHSDGWLVGTRTRQSISSPAEETTASCG